MYQVNKTLKRISLQGAIGTSLALTLSVQADLLSFQGEYQSELEERAAVSNQATYDQLKSQGCTDSAQIATASCAGGSFLVWNNVRELVHTANELTNVGPTEFSLDSDLEGLGFSLRWTSGEEFSSEESLSDSFVSGQLTNLASRVTALRSGTRGFNTAGFNNGGNNTAIARRESGNSGLNSGDGVTGDWSRLGGFINGSYTYGNQDPSGREDAFDFEGMDVNGGLDYRLDDNWVVGAIFGYIKNEVDFDARLSIVEGGVEMDGLSIMPFVLYQSENWFYNASLGYLQSEFETDRSIRYPSFNTNVDSVNTRAVSKHDANTLSASFSAGYSYFIRDNWLLEPSLSVNYQDVTIDEFSERDINNEGFDFLVEEQNIESLETVLSLKTQYTMSNNYGVFVPYIEVHFYKQHEDEQRFIDAAYVNVAQILDKNARFSLPTNSVDSDYKVYSIGMSTVLRGARQKTADSTASGGIQAFINYRKLEDIAGYHQQIVSAGIRYEF